MIQKCITSFFFPWLGLKISPSLSSSNLIKAVYIYYSELTMQLSTELNRVEWDQIDDM